jgi:predicted ester cyclase
MDLVKTIENTLEQVFEKGNLEIIPITFSEKYLAHAGEKTYHGHQFIRQFSTQLRRALPDVKIQHIEIISESENVISWQRTFSGTHEVALKGIPASHKKLKWKEMLVTKFENDKIVEEWILSDLALQLILKQVAKH